MFSSATVPHFSCAGIATLFDCLPARYQPRASGTRIRSRIHALLDGEYNDRDLHAIVDVVRRLVALRLLFRPQQEEHGMPRTFDLNAPLQGIHIGNAGIARLLRRSSHALTLPAGPATDRIVEGVWRIVHDGGERNRKKFIRTGLSTIAIYHDSAPSVWPAHDMQIALLAGDWDRVDLTGAMLTGADLRGVNWQDAVLSRANLQMANLDDVTLEGANFSFADLTGAKLRNAHLDRSLWRHANMGHAIATGAFLRNTLFEGSNLDGANFRGAHLENASGLACGPATVFEDATLDRTEVTVKKKVDRHGDDTTDMTSRQLHRRCDIRNAQLKALLTIDIRYNAVFLAAVGALIDISEEDGGSCHSIESYSCALLPQQRCWQDPKICALVEDKLVRPLLTRWNIAPRDAEEPSHAVVVEFLQETRMVLEMGHYSGAISQLIFAEAIPDGRPGPLPALDDMQRALQQRFLAAPDMVPLVDALEDIEQGLAPLCRIFTTRDCSRALIYEDTVFRKMGLGLASPCDGYLFERGANGNFFNQNLYNPNDALCPQTLPLILKEMQLAPAACHAAVSHIPDGSPHREQFLAALGQRALPAPEADLFKQRVPLGEDIALMEHFQGFYVGVRCDKLFQVDMAHVDYLTKIIADSHAWVKHTASDQARIMVCIGTLFVRYSAQQVFGTEYDSHTSLRDYARACLNRAHALDSRLIPECVIEIRQTLLGTANYPQCTAQLAIRLFLKLTMQIHDDHRLALYFNALYPPAWR